MRHWHRDRTDLHTCIVSSLLLSNSNQWTISEHTRDRNSIYSRVWRTFVVFWNEERWHPKISYHALIHPVWSTEFSFFSVNMCECCGSIKESFFVRKIIPPIAILVNLALTIFFVVSNAKNYDRYKNRPSYIIYRVSNTTTDYFIIRENLTDAANCSSEALFTFDVTTVYENIVSRQGARNLLFISVYWLSTIVALLFSSFDIIRSMMTYCRKEYDDYEYFNESSSFGYRLIGSVGSQFLQKGSFLIPTYFIGIFDYTQLCLSHHTKASLFLLHHSYISITICLGSMVYLVLWTWACWDSQRHDFGSGILWVKYVKTLTCDNRTATTAVFVLLCLLVIPIGIYGTFVWVTSLMEFLLTTKAILICFNFIIGLFHDLVKFCRHCW